jgi:UPF0042 nucleotide-binding protein
MANYVANQPAVVMFVTRMIKFITHVATLDSYQKIGIGCNAGRHRSPIVAGLIWQQLQRQWWRKKKKEIRVRLRHEDLGAFEQTIYESVIEGFAQTPKTQAGQVPATADDEKPLTRKGTVHLRSFGFKLGPPLANNFLDVTFAKNPARDDRWRDHGTIDSGMVEFIRTQPEVGKFVKRVVSVVEHLSSVDPYQKLAVGCNFGRHRGPIIAKLIQEKLRDRGIPTLLHHADLPDYEHARIDTLFR